MELHVKAIIAAFICLLAGALLVPHPPQTTGVFSYNKKLQGAFKIAHGHLSGPEDLAVDISNDGILLYTACMDGWVKRISLREDSHDVHVENWTYVGGRPLGVALGLHGELLVCEPAQGLLNVTQGNVEVLSNEAEGLKYKLADGVDVSREGIVYFTDASYKYGIEQSRLDIIECGAHGRLLKYDPSTKTTSLLLGDLYFPNGVALSPKQDFLVFCETSMRRCRKFWLEGPKMGSVESFIDELPGFPDNIRYDGNGIFWIAFPRVWNGYSRAMEKYPFLRHVAVGLLRMAPRVVDAMTNPGSSVLGVKENGQPVGLYSDPDGGMITVGLKIGNDLYYGSLYLDYIGRLHVGQR